MHRARRGSRADRPLPRSFYLQPTLRVARSLLGKVLVHDTAEGRASGRIVEVEAYRGPADRAAHSRGGHRSPRNEAMWGMGGHAYVYFIYGMHHCLNAVTGQRDLGSAVLIRAGEPVCGAGAMAARRGLGRPPRPGDLAGGPGRLCQALGIDRALDGAPLWRGELTIAEGEPTAPGEVAAGPRIGVAYAGEAAEWPLRFAVRGNPHVSRPRL